MTVTNPPPIPEIITRLLETVYPSIAQVAGFGDFEHKVLPDGVSFVRAGIGIGIETAK